MRTEQEYRNLEAENAFLRDRLENAEKDAERYKEWKRSFMEGELRLFNMLAECSTKEEHDAAIDAAIKAQKEGKS